MLITQISIRMIFNIHTETLTTFVIPSATKARFLLPVIIGPAWNVLIMRVQ